MFRNRFRRDARARRRMATLDNVRFCACLEFVGFEHNHAFDGRSYRVLVIENENSDIAARAASLYWSDAVSVDKWSDDTRAKEDAIPALVVRVETLRKGRFRVVVETASGRAGTDQRG